MLRKMYKFLEQVMTLPTTDKELLAFIGEEYKGVQLLKKTKFLPNKSTIPADVRSWLSECE